jgi:hypothetical protein
MRGYGFEPPFFQQPPYFPSPLSIIPPNSHKQPKELKTVVTIDPIQGMITSYLASPQGQEMIRNYLSSPEGQKAICEFVTTPKGREAMKQILPGILGCMSLPRDLQSAVARKLKEIP